MEPMDLDYSYIIKTVVKVRSKNWEIEDEMK
jgi:hypothetical protein